MLPKAESRMQPNLSRWWAFASLALVVVWVLLLVQNLRQPGLYEASYRGLPTWSGSPQIRHALDLMYTIFIASWIPVCLITSLWFMYQHNRALKMCSRVAWASMVLVALSYVVFDVVVHPSIIN